LTFQNITFSKIYSPEVIFNVAGELVVQTYLFNALLKVNLFIHGR